MISSIQDNSINTHVMQLRNLVIRLQNENQQYRDKCLVQDRVIREYRKKIYAAPSLCIQAATVCVNYSDYLEFTIDRNIQQINKWYIVTTAEDVKTQKLCKKYNNIYPIITNVFYDDGAAFNKGKGLNLAIKQFNQDDWCLILDADTILPPNVKRDILTLDDIDGIYSYDRVFIKNKDGLIKKFKTDISNEEEIEVQGVPFNGYIQLYHPTSRFLKIPCYSEIYKDASTSDHEFSKQWPFNEHKKFTNHAIHLGPSYTNWSGRVTDLFK